MIEQHYLDDTMTAIARRARITLAIAALAAACARAPADAPPKSAIGEFGLDQTAQDPSVHPGDDFFRHANGRWLAANEIPLDRTRWGSFDQLSAQAEEQVRQLIETLAADAPAGSVPRKVGDYYRAYLDMAAIDAAGLTPLQPALRAIDDARTHEAIAALMGRPDLPVRSPIAFGISADQKNPDRYIVSIAQSGLGLPDREYYLGTDPALVSLRAEYRAHVARMLGLAGLPLPEAQAKAIVDLETRIAREHWPAAKRRERDLTYNPRTLDALRQTAPRFPWTAFLAAADLGDRREFIVREVDAVESLARQVTEVPVATWQSYLRYHVINGRADVLPTAIDAESFAFYGRTLNGQQQIRDRWKRAVAAVGTALGEAAGQLYVAKHFPPESKAKMTALVENLRTAYATRIKTLPWMSDETKTVALEKLAAFRPKVGYPDTWRDYGALEIRAGDAFGNQVRASVFAWNRVRRRLDQPTDRDEWQMTPQTVNAYYNSVFNEIVFPAAILQPPFFDPQADDAVNYGAIGGIIGHEMGHGFDDQGSKSDAKGVLRTWWRPDDESRFKELVAGLASQYERYEALPGLHLNGRLTLGENIGDLGGLSVAHEAYRLSQGGKAPPVLGGLSGDQRFFLSWAQAWRTLIREARLRTQVMSNPHSPSEFRVNGVVRNMDAWYSAFGVQPSHRLFLAPESRVRIW